MKMVERKCNRNMKWCDVVNDIIYSNVISYYSCMLSYDIVWYMILTQYS